MLKNISAALVAVFAAASVAMAAYVSASLSAPYNVASTSFATPPGLTITTKAVNTSFNGGLISLWVCAANIVIKDPSQALLPTRVLFNGAAGSAGGTTNNADGSQTRTYAKVSPPGLGSHYTCTTQGQVAKQSGSADVLLDPAAGDLFRVEGDL